MTRCRAALILAVTLTGAVGSAAAAPSASVLEIPPGAAAGPDFDVERATRAYLDLLTPELRARSDDYFEGGYVLLVVDLLYGLAVAWLLLRTRLSARMRDLAERLVKRQNLRVALYAVQYIVLTGLMTFPLTWYEGFHREHAYGLATQTIGEWLGDRAKGLAIGAVLGTLAIVVLYAVIRRFPRRWWLGGAIAGLAMLVFMAVIAPVLIAPVFNRYQPLEPGPVRESILSMARANGVPADEVYWFDASRQTTRISANVSGLFATMRISLNDNLLRRTSPEEIEAVMGHELGHYVLAHVWSLLTSALLVLVVGLAAIRWAFGRLASRHGQRWHVRADGDPAGLPLLVAIASVYFFLATPITNSMVRAAESQADIFGLNAARQPDGFARVAIRLSDYRKLEPSPLEELIFFDHPSGRTRVEMAMRWKAEQIVRAGAR